MPEPPAWLERLMWLVNRGLQRWGKAGFVILVTLGTCVVTLLINALLVCVLWGPDMLFVWENFWQPLIVAAFVAPAELLPALAMLGYLDRLSYGYRQLAEHDPLTGALNRHGLFERMSQAPVGALVAVVDIDRFKSLNDTHGHHYGDEVLVATAGRLRSIFGASALIARTGGDEFVVISPGRAQVQDTLSIETPHGPVTASLGTATLDGVSAAPASHPDGDRRDGAARDPWASVGQDPSPADRIREVEAAVAAADHAMYLAKRARRPNSGA